MGTIADLIDRLAPGPVEGLARPREEQEEDILEVPDDLSEMSDEGLFESPLLADPKPARKTTSNKTRTKGTSSEKVQVKDALALLIKTPATLWAMRDPRCGGRMLTQADATIDALTPIILRNPAMLAWFTAAGAPWLDILALVTALAPVASDVWGHHIRHDGRQEVSDDLSSYAAPPF